MTALTTDRNTTRKEGFTAAYPVATGTIIYAGSLVCLNSNGYAVPASDKAGLKFVGVSRQYVDNSSGADGDATVLVWIAGIFDFDASDMSIEDVGKPVFVSDDHTVGLSTTNGVGCGIITEVESATKVWIDIGIANRRAVLEQENSTAAEVAELVADFNALLAKLKAAGIMASQPSQEG